MLFRSRTLSARYYKDGSEILIAQEGKNPRKLTPRECARLQGYDDSYKIVVSDTQAYKQFGNSVVVPLIKEVAGNIVSVMLDLDQQNFFSSMLEMDFVQANNETRIVVNGLA